MRRDHIGEPPSQDYISSSRARGGVPILGSPLSNTDDRNTSLAMSEKDGFSKH